MYLEIMRRRTSVRSYKPGGIPAAARESLEASLKALTGGPFGRPVRLTLVDVDAGAGESLREYGTYGLIRGVETFIAGCVGSGRGDAEDYGYCMEKAIIESTRLGLGTVWLGGTLNRSTFGKKLAVRSDELVPAVSPVGTPTERRSLSDRLIRGVASSAKRKSFDALFFEGSSLAPLAESAAGDARELLRAVQWGPSASNKQPWRLVHDGAKTHFFLDEDKPYNARFAGVPIQGLDLGIAMAHYELACLDLHRGGGWEIEPPGFPTPWTYVISWVASAPGVARP